MIEDGARTIGTRAQPGSWAFGSATWPSVASVGAFEMLIVSLQRHLYCGRAQPTDAQQVVRGGSQVQKIGVAAHSAQAGLAKAADSLSPAEELLDALAHDLARPVGLGVERAAIEPFGFAPLDAGDVRTDAPRAQLMDEALSVIALVGSDALRLHVLATLAHQHLEGFLRLVCADRLRGSHIGDEPVPVIHQGVPGKAQLRFLAFRFAKELRFWVRRARVRLVLAPLAVEVSIPTGTGGRTSTILG